MNKRKVLLSLFFLFLFFLILCNSSYAATINLGSNKLEVKSGDTVEVYVDLGIESVAYDLNILLSDESLIKSKEMESKVGKGDLDRIYLIQVAQKEERIIYKPNTRLAVFKYIVSDVLLADKTLDITVSGEVVGKSSTERNSVNEKLTIKLHPQDVDDYNQKVIQTNKETEEVLSTIPVNPEVKSDEQTKTDEQTDSEETTIRVRFDDGNNEEQTQNINPNNDNKDATITESNKKKSSVMPITGDDILKMFVLLALAIAVIVVIEIIKRKKKGE